MAGFSSPGVFIPDMLVPGAPGFSALGNATALQTAIDDAEASGNLSAIILIPSYCVVSGTTFYGHYPIDVSDGPITVSGNVALLICGTGEGTQLELSTGDNATLFDVQGANGVTFQDLFIEFPVISPTKGEGTAIQLTGGAGHTVSRLTFRNCQYPIAVSGAQDVRVLNCLAYYTSGYPSTITKLSAIGLTGSCSGVTIGQCLFRCDVGAGSADYYGLFIDGASDVNVSDSQFQGFGTGTLIQGSSALTSGIRFSGVRAESALGSCLQINPSVYDLSFVDTHFQAGADYSGEGPGIAIGTGGGVTNDQIDTIRFMSCSLTGGTSGTYGLEIGAAQNVQIHGGDYSGNGPAAGIAVSGGATEIQIIGANCVGLEYEGGGEPTPLYQQYGISITNGADIQIIDVVCSGNGLPGSPGEGIRIDGTGAAVSNVKIIGASCVGPLGRTDIEQQSGISVTAASNVLVKGCTLSGSLTSPGHGLYLGAVTDATVDSCNVLGNTSGVDLGSGSARVYLRRCNASGYGSYTAAISVDPSLTEVEITDCPGYNDQRVVLGTIAPVGNFNGVSVKHYYGPVVFYVTKYNVMIDTQPTLLSSGGFTLAPGKEQALVTAARPGATFIMIGN